MKITRRQLRQIIQEESQILSEERDHPGQLALQDALPSEPGGFLTDNVFINIVEKAKQEYWESARDKMATVLESYPEVWNDDNPLGLGWEGISSIEDFKSITHDDVRHLGPVGQKVFVGDPLELHKIRESTMRMTNSLWGAYDNLPEKQ